MKKLVICAVESYKRYISPFLPYSCRFDPSCSSYCLEAVRRYGAVKGLRISLIRILKCHPFHPGGYDPLENHESSDIRGLTREG